VLNEQSICKLCGTRAKLVKSHIIPKAFFRDIALAGKTLSAHSLVPGVPPRRIPTGVYGQIICEACEQRLAHFDAYGIQFLRRDVSAFEVVGGNRELGLLRTGDVDYALLKIFLLSVLWRAHASQDEVFERVDLGKFEPVLRDMILAENPGRKEDFATWLARCTGDEGPGVFQPFRDREEGRNVYRFTFGMHDIVCMVDGQPPRGSKLPNSRIGTFEASLPLGSASEVVAITSGQAGDTDISTTPL
jgi:hypothetical protein